MNLANQNKGKRWDIKEDEGGAYRGIVGVICGHGGGGLGGELIELAGGDALIDAGTHLLGDEHRVAVLLAEPVAQLLKPRRDLIEVDGLGPSVPLHYVHPRSFCADFRRTNGRGEKGGDECDREQRRATRCGFKLLPWAENFELGLHGHLLEEGSSWENFGANGSLSSLRVPHFRTFLARVSRMESNAC